MTYTNAELARIVREKNQAVNDGRGSSVLDAVIWYLERDDLDNAQYKCMLDHDKLRQYNIDDWLRDVGLFSDDYVARLNRANWKWR
ncbi:MAG: hypothetical protein WC761_00065 [Candidatus Paceibacterota bacterium]